METLASNQRLILIDEGGNFDFSAKGTSYFIMTAVSKSFSYSEHAELAKLKYDLLSKQRLLLAGFHASEDRQVVRNQVFGIIKEHLHHHRIYAVIYEKGTLSAELKRSTNLYTHAIDSLMGLVLSDPVVTDGSTMHIITDQIPTKHDRKLIEKGIKVALSARFSELAHYTLNHVSSSSNFDLQIADYCNWAIYRKWASGDARSYDFVKECIISEQLIIEK
jgi:hypothetical protein